MRAWQAGCNLAAHMMVLQGFVWGAVMGVAIAAAVRPSYQVRVIHTHDAPALETARPRALTPRATAELEDALAAVMAHSSASACKPGRGPVTVTFMPETDVRELLTWAMGFTCKGFVFDPRIVSSGKKLTVLAPHELTPDEAYQVFQVGLSTVGLEVVPAGAVNTIVEASVAREPQTTVVDVAAGVHGAQLATLLHLMPSERVVAIGDHATTNDAAASAALELYPRGAYVELEVSSGRRIVLLLH